MKRGNLHIQKLILRIIAVFSLPVLPAVFAPRLAVEKLSWLLGFGEPPHVPLIGYLAAGGSYVYLFLSAMLWIISSDVARYRPLVVFAGWACLVGGPAYAWIGTNTGMPHWWMLMDTVTCFVGGLALLWAAGPSEPSLSPAAGNVTA